jgi:hypothetical protein
MYIYLKVKIFTKRPSPNTTLKEVKAVTLRVKEDSYEFSIRPRIEPERYILARGVLGRLPVLPSWPHRSTAGSEAWPATSIFIQGLLPFSASLRNMGGPVCIHENIVT